jgi:hypothetical protein
MSKGWKVRVLTVGTVMAMAVPAFGFQPPNHFHRGGNTIQISKTDMTGFIQVGDDFATFNGRLTDGKCTYATSADSDGNQVGPNDGIIIQASGSCKGIGTGELVLEAQTTDVAPFNTLSSGQTDFVEVGKYAVIAPGKNNQGMAIVDGGNYEKVYDNNGQSFMLRLTGVTANTAINGPQ